MTDPLKREVRILPPEHFTLHPLHDEFRRVQRAGLAPEWFCYEVCNNMMNLPEQKLGQQWHVPAAVPGWMDGQGFGWRVSDFVIVMPYLGISEVNFKTCLLSWTGDFFKRRLMALGIDLNDCMVTHAMRFPLPNGITSYSQAHKSAGQAYVRSDCYACNPRAILTCGSDALKALFGRDAKIDSYRGGVHEWMGIPVIPTCSPATFAATTAGIEVFDSELYRLVQVSMKGWVSGAPQFQPGYRVCRYIDEIEQLEKDLIEADAKFLSIDTEFGNTTGREEHNKLRSIQIAWGAGKSAYIYVRGPSMAEVHSPEDMQRLKDCVKRILLRDGVRLEGHHLRTDINMLFKEGMDVDAKLETGFCTMIARDTLHGSEGDESDGLDHIIRRYVPQFQNYWKPTEDWLDKNGRKESLRFGYGRLPDEILILYALIDGDATWQAARLIEAELDEEKNKRLKDLFWNIRMPTALHLMDVERQGILYDPLRVKRLRDFYEPEYLQILDEFRMAINWPDFNPNSKDQKATFLFSTTEYRDKKAPPEDAKVLDLDPLYNTDKYPKEWHELVIAGESHRHFPSTKAATIDLMWNNHKHIPELKMLKQLSVLGKFLSTYLNDCGKNELGYREDGKKIVNNICDDGRVRTHLHQTSSTARYRSHKPNLQTNPKRQEEAALAIFVDRRFSGMSLDEYKRRTDKKKREELGKDYIPEEIQIDVPGFKSSYICPEGWAFIEVDFKTAEICVLAYCSGDLDLIAVLDQDRDLHMEVAVREFKLPMLQQLEEALVELKAGNSKPYLKWKKEAKNRFPAQRTAAKTVIFGLMYGRGAPALAREISKTGAVVTREDCEMIIEAFAKAYPKAWAWLQANMDSAIENGYCETAYGSRRFFKGIQDMRSQDQAKARREAANAPIQGTVAYLLQVAGVNLYRTRYRTQLGIDFPFRVDLPIHDAFLVEFPYSEENVKKMKAILKLCMSTLNEIPGTGRSLGLDMEVFPYRWGNDEHRSEALAA